MRTALIRSGIAAATFFVSLPAPAAQTCELDTSSATCVDTVCPVVIWQDKNKKWFVNPYYLKVTTKPARIIWLLVQGSQFSGPNDGIELPAALSSQFEVSYATDEVSEDPKPRKPGPNWHARFKNDNTQPAKGIKYEVYFTDVHGEPVHCDPWINNSGKP